MAEEGDSPSFFRSEEMQLLQLFVQSEAAHDTVDELGELGVIQFRDMNPGVNLFHRQYVKDVKRADELERKLLFFLEQAQRADVLRSAPEVLGIEQTLDDLEHQCTQLEAELKESIKQEETLNKNKNELIEMRHVFNKSDSFFDQTEAQSSTAGRSVDPDDVRSPLLGGHEDDIEEQENKAKSVRLGFITGVVLQEKLPTFERVLFRATRGCVYLRHKIIDEQIVDPRTGEEVQKTVFIVFFNGERLKTKVTKLCESFGAHLYKYPEPNERREMAANVESRLQDLNTVIDRTVHHRVEMVQKVAKDLTGWLVKVRKEKAIYHTLNMFNYDTSRKCHIAEGWCPKRAVEGVQMALRRATARSGAQVPSIVNVLRTNEQPPTSFVTTKYTQAIQSMIEAYGVARYQEMNPAPFAVITFPFLFSVMYGDIGHGLILVAFAMFLIYKEKDWEGKNITEMVKMMYQGRYILFMMGLFSIYAGFIYNECMAVPFNLFGSNWEYGGHNTTATRVGGPEGTYPFGVDPYWHHASNGLVFTNSMKMKMSILLGVTQMYVGLFLSLLNAIHFRKWINIFCEFIPQFIFLSSTFGYLCLLILFKWTTYWPDSKAPSLTQTLIAFFMGMGGLPPEPEKGYSFTLALYGDFDGHTQQGVQVFLLVMAVISIPWMIFTKPYIQYKNHQKTVQYQPMNATVEDENFDVSEVFVNQVIHSIEYILGCVSNTASYLRLWALSLAHAQLSSVFWVQIMEKVLNMEASAFSHGVFLMVGASVWIVMNIGVLVVMESLSAFLHDLRLHWIEFMNKFYAGDGVKFVPFAYSSLVKGHEEDAE